MITNSWRSFRGRVSLLPLSVILLFLGCAGSHTIEPGLWRLDFKPRDNKGDSLRYIRPMPRDVEVELDWGEEKDTELIKVQYQTQMDSKKGLRSLKGKIIKGGEVHLEGVDPDWFIWLRGTVLGPEMMDGNAWIRGRWKDISHDYLWTMERISREE